MIRLPVCTLVSLSLALTADAASTPLETFTVKDYLQHQWTEELVHFPIAYSGDALPPSLTLTDADGKPSPCQVSGLAQKDGQVTGTVWTVVSVPPKGQVTLYLRQGEPAPGGVRLVAEGQDYVLANALMALRLPRLPGDLEQAVHLASLPAPLLAVGGPDGKTSFGRGTWTDADQPLRVKQATTTVLETGPVRMTVRYRLVFTDGHFYQADISLGDRQDCALFTDTTDVEAPKAAFRFAFQPGLGADRIYWRSNYWREQTKGLTPGPINFDKEDVIFHLRPWTFWWANDRATWAGFYKAGADSFVGVLALRPSRWTPVDWGGFERSEIPVTVRPGGQIDMNLGLLAMTRKKADGTSYLATLHRELAITVGTVAENVAKETAKAKLRRQLIKYSEFPLDEVKDFGFDFKPTHPDQKHPYLLFTQVDVDRARRQAKTVPVMKAELAKVTRYLAGLGVDPVKQIKSGPDGPLKFYRQHYTGNYLYIVAPTAYLASDDPQYGLILASGVKGLARENMDMFLETPNAPSIGGNAHLGGTRFLQLLLAFDTIADSSYLTGEEKQDIQAVLIFGCYVLAHPDYWNNAVGLCSANPNMTSLMRLPLGLQALFLDGHPQSANWLKFSEAELQRELKEYIAPGGGFVESPAYQGASLDGMFLLSQAMKNVKGKDYFAAPPFKATMDYYGFLLTPPDPRFPIVNPNHLPTPMVLPSIGDMFAGVTSSFNGWMARATAKADPAYSARQQFYWKAQNTAALAPAGRADGFTLALVDAELPTAPPNRNDLARPFPGVGSVLRTSWTDPKATYVLHRSGNFGTLGHWHYDFNEIVYDAKGAPLCPDFGHYAYPDRPAPFYHNTVSFDLDTSSRAGRWGNFECTDPGYQLEVISLPHTIDYSYGRSSGNGGQRDDRHLLLVKSADPLGANYLVIRDVTRDGQLNQEFYWNLWCLAKDVQGRRLGIAPAKPANMVYNVIDAPGTKLPFTPTWVDPRARPSVLPQPAETLPDNVVHFVGQLGVDLDVHVLSPADPRYLADYFGWRQQVSNIPFTEEEYCVHIRKQGSKEDFFTVLYPRAAGQEPAQVTAVADGRAVEVTHLEGKDIVLLSPGKVATVASGDMRLRGEIAYARRYADGRVSLALVKGAGAFATCGPWTLRSDGPAAIRVKGTIVHGESSGEAHTAVIGLPSDYGVAVVTLAGKPAQVKREKDVLTLDLPAGCCTFTIQREQQK